MSLTQQQILGFLPHGSGIDCKWETDENRKYFLFTNSFHAMNEHGMYDGYCDFTLKVSRDNVRDFQLTFQGAKSHYLNRKYQLRDYLEETLGYALEQCDRHFNEPLSDSAFKPPIDL